MNQDLVSYTILPTLSFYYKFFIELERGRYDINIINRAFPRIARTEAEHGKPDICYTMYLPEGGIQVRMNFKIRETMNIL